MTISYDKEIDAQYVQVKPDAVARTIPLNDWLIVDYNKLDQVVGIEVLSQSQHPVAISVDYAKGVTITLIKNTPTLTVGLAIPTGDILKESERVESFA